MRSTLLLALLLTAGAAFGNPDETGERVAVPTALQDCGTRLNCVSSQHDAGDAPRYVEPLQYDGDEDAAKARLKEIIGGMKRTQLVEENGPYLHFTFTTLIFRFVDDVEFLFDPSRKAIHVRSASRVGTGDMGVNRKRVDRIRTAWEAAE